MTTGSCKCSIPALHLDEGAYVKRHELDMKQLFIMLNTMLQQQLWLLHQAYSDVELGYVQALKANEVVHARVKVTVLL